MSGPKLKDSVHPDTCDVYTYTRSILRESVRARCCFIFIRSSRRAVFHPNLVLERWRHLLSKFHTKIAGAGRLSSLATARIRERLRR